MLVGEVYASSPPAVRGRLIEMLMRPLSLLCLSAVSGGLFAAIRLRGDWRSGLVTAEDAQAIQPPDVAALADMVMQVDADWLDGLQAVLSNPSIAGVAAAAVLLAVLATRRKPNVGPEASG